MYRASGQRFSIPQGLCPDALYPGTSSPLISLIQGRGQLTTSPAERRNWPGWSSLPCYGKGIRIPTGICWGSSEFLLYPIDRLNVWETPPLLTAGSEAHLRRRGNSLPVSCATCIVSSYASRFRTNLMYQPHSVFGAWILGIFDVAHLYIHIPESPHAHSCVASRPFLHCPMSIPCSATKFCGMGVWRNCDFLCRQRFSFCLFILFSVGATQSMQKLGCPPIRTWTWIVQKIVPIIAQFLENP